MARDKNRAWLAGIIAATGMDQSSTEDLFDNRNTAIYLMPFPTKMFCEERWIGKQECIFTWWLNDVLTPDDFKVHTEGTKVNRAVSIAMGSGDKLSMPKAPTKEEMSFSTYLVPGKINHLHGSALQLFTSKAMVKAIRKLQLKVEAKILVIPKDCCLWKDVGLRSKVLNWLLSYNPLWLRLGLETIYGEMIPLESNSDASGLATFILQRLFWNQDIAADFGHRTKPHLYKEGLEEALSRFTLKKLLLLVCFLDRAKESRLIEHNPCLFCLDAEFKSSKDLLLAFSRVLLKEEGNLPRHLHFLGLSVSHVQMPRDEFNFTVKNLAVDLKCGIRLVRVMEILLQDSSLSAKLHLPAVSRKQKIHNVDIALQVLKSKGVDLKHENDCINSRDIVDGHRGKTLSLLLRIIFAFHMEVVLNEDQLTEEIGYLKKTLSTKRRMAELKADRGFQSSLAKSIAPYEHSQTKITLLMDWVQAVCDFYNLKVENFTVSFSDGRVLCYLIHHYRFSLPPEAAASNSTTQSVELSTSAGDSDSSSDSVTNGPNGPCSPSVEFKELLENEKNNFSLVNTAVTFLAGMNNPAYMSNTIPNEKVVMSYLSFLCACLLEQRRQTRAALVIQGAWSNYKLKKDLQILKAMHQSAVIIQRYYHSWILQRRDRQQFLKTKEYIIVLQAAYRGHMARKKIGEMRQAATIIQRKCITYQHRKRFLAIKAAALLCQQRYRAVTLARKVRSDYLSKRGAVICLQAAYRGYEVRKQLHVQLTAAVTIQSYFRMYQRRTSYKKLHWAASVLQARYRANKKMREEMQVLTSQSNSAIVLQAAFRGMKSRQIIKQRHQAAGVIQRTYRTHCQRKQFHTLRSSVLIIQKKYRATVAAKERKQEYQKVRRAAVLLQVVYRGQQVRKEVAHWHHAATVIQSAFRGHREEVKFQATRQSAVIIQRYYRSWILQRRDRQQFLKTKESIIVLQAAYRGHMAMKKIGEMHQAATIIQRKCIAYRERKRFLAIKAAALVFQQRYLAVTLARKDCSDYLSMRRTVICLQAAYRGYEVRKQLHVQRTAAVTIQSYFRMYQQRTYYNKFQWAASVLQARYRANKKMREEMQVLTAKWNCAIVLQAAFRGMKSRQIIKQRHRAAGVIQRTYRTHCQRKQFHTLKSSVLIIQRKYRATVAAKERKQEYQKVRRAAVLLQVVYRGQQVRKEVAHWHHAATVVQSAFRRHREEVKFQATRQSAVIIQRYYRSWILQRRDRQQFLKTKESIIVLQAAYRGHMARKKIGEMHQAATIIQRKCITYRDRKRFLAIKAAALVLQQRYRAVTLARKVCSDYLSKRRNVICLQAAYRGYEVRKQLHVQRTAAVTIQSYFRMYQQRTYYKKFQWAASVLQVRYRANKKMREEMQVLTAQRHSAIVLQAAFRGMKSRQIIRQRHQAAGVIQRANRTHCQRKQFLTLKSSVLIIQRRYRATVAAKERKQEYQEVRRAAVLLQAVYRGQQVIKELAHWNQAATVIQSAFRRHREEVKFQATRQSAVIIQRYYRSRILQRRDKQQFMKSKKSIIVLQAPLRGLLVRRHKAASLIQVAVRKFLLLRRQRRAEPGIIKAQALWRGHHSRLLNYTPKLMELRHSLLKVSADVQEEDKLGNKTSSALNCLLHYKYFSEILKALKNLETTTRLSPECCKQLVESGATNIIFTLIRGCNRSLPCMEIITFSIQILLNLSKYHKTIKAVYLAERSMETLLDLLQRYREKAGDKLADESSSIFTKTCFLLALLVQDEHCAEDVMKLPKVMDRICNIHRLTARKHRMESERTIIEQKMNPSLYGSFLVQATLHKSRPALKFAPDWVLRRDKINDIVDPLRAIQMVANSLSIVL